MIRKYFFALLFAIALSGYSIISLSKPRDIIDFQDKLSHFTDFYTEDYSDHKVYKCIGYKLEINPDAAWVDKNKLDTSFPKAINTLSDEYKEKLERNCQLLTGQMLPFEITYKYSNKDYLITGQFILTAMIKK